MSAATPGQAMYEVMARRHVVAEACNSVIVELLRWDELDDDLRAEWEAAAQAAIDWSHADRDLAAASGDGTLRSRITRLAEAWEANPKLTEEGQLLRDLGQVLRDELGYASDREPEPAADLREAQHASRTHRERLQELLADTPFEFRPDWAAEYEDETGDVSVPEPS